ncbi:TPA: hypothetical protein N0F65_010638 [Lagenidium giganteum]|uniref:Phosphoribosyl-AMP cyclohydrolase domain-containing protein n=1 Tax=Lagenidium giganteum TaxID=4803 RepID=A0AAV2ZD81_9STRA|nr:TPA: hypothetical protein N0F65_010638 [Lagenidium giganteum]
MLVPELSLTAAALQAEAEKDHSAQWSHIKKLSILSFLYANLFREKLVALALTPAAGANSAQDQELRNTLIASRAILGPFNADMMDSAIIWLDHGIRKVLVAAESSEDVDLQTVAEAVSQLPQSRVVLRIPVDMASLINRDEGETPHAETSVALRIQEKLKRLKDVASGFVIAIRAPASHLGNAAYQAEFEVVSKALQMIREGLDEGDFFAVEWVSAKQESFDRSVMLPRIGDLHRKGISVVAPALPQVSDEQRTRLVDAGQAFVRCLRSDRPDGLFTTVVTDESGVALGLVYSSEESVLAAIATGRGVYYSRSRKGLWKKGKSSGNYQTLVQLDLDCDSDALRFMVRQDGSGFCHLNTRTCWGEAGGLRYLQAMLESRLQDAPTGSYTKRLFNDPELLRNKLVEEAQELAEAETPTHVSEEAADVMYFAMVRCVAAGATLNDVEKQLDKRSLKVKRRPGNSKAYRIDAAQEILNKRQKK